MTTYCTRCSTKFDDADRFCAQCGAARPDAVASLQDAPGVAPNPPTKPWNPSLAIGLGVLAPLAIGARRDQTTAGSTSPSTRSLARRSRSRSRAAAATPTAPTEPSSRCPAIAAPSSMPRCTAPAPWSTTCAWSRVTCASTAPSRTGRASSGTSPSTVAEARSATHSAGGLAVHRDDRSSDGHGIGAQRFSDQRPQT